jgi:hypothetical protein
MINTKAKLAAILGVAVATTFSAASADARIVRREMTAHQTAIRGAHAEQRSHHRSYSYAPAIGGGYFVEPNGPSNYNRNAN